MHEADRALYLWYWRVVIASRYDLERAWQNEPKVIDGYCSTRTMAEEAVAIITEQYHTPMRVNIAYQPK